MSRTGKLAEGANQSGRFHCSGIINGKERVLCLNENAGTNYLKPEYELSVYGEYPMDAGCAAGECGNGFSTG